MFKASDVHSLSDFQRNTKEHLKRLKRTKRPTLLTVNGKAAVVVMDAESYDAVQATIERAELIKEIRAGMEEARQGKTRTADEFFEELYRKNEIEESDEANRGISLGLESMRRGEGIALEDAKAQFTARTGDNDRASRKRPRRTEAPRNEGPSK